MWIFQIQIRNDTTLANLICGSSCKHWYFVICLHFRRGLDRWDLWHTLYGGEISENVLWTADGKTLLCVCVCVCVCVWRTKTKWTLIIYLYISCETGFSWIKTGWRCALWKNICGLCTINHIWKKRTTLLRENYTKIVLTLVQFLSF